MIQFIELRYEGLEKSIMFTRSDSDSAKAGELLMALVGMHKRLMKKGKVDKFTANTKFILIEVDICRSWQCSELFEDGRSMVDIHVTREDSGTQHCHRLEQLFQEWWKT